jgi:transposase-like protein
MERVPTLSDLVALNDAVNENEQRLRASRSRLLNAIIDRRHWVSTLRPKCPKCNEERQIQIIDALAAPAPRWKCRKCKHSFKWGPEEDNNSTDHG